MSEIKPASIDLVITDPPWNMGVKFGEKVDFQPEESYQKFIENVVSNLGIVMKNEGLCVIICAEKVRHTNNTVNLPELYSKIFLNFGFNLIEAQSILLEEYGNFEWDAIPISKWDEKNSWAYSKEGKFLIFSKIREIQSTVLSKIGEKTYQSKPEEGHPCPSSLKMVNDLLNYLYSEGMNVFRSIYGNCQSWCSGY
jgi:DNA modification methylase